MYSTGKMADHECPEVYKMEVYKKKQKKKPRLKNSYHNFFLIVVQSFFLSVHILRFY